MVIEVDGLTILFGIGILVVLIVLMYLHRYEKNKSTIKK